MAARVTPLINAVRFPVVVKHLGQLQLVVALLTIVPLAVALLGREWGLASRFAIAIVVLGGLGCLASRRRGAAEIQPNEAMVIVAGAFVVASLAMAWPLMAAGLSFLDALFESISGVTTTGLSTLSTVEDRPVPFLFARAWMQWYGGLGIAVLALALLLRPGSSARRLALIETEESDVVGGTHAHARRLILVYAALTAAAVLTLWIIGGEFREAILHALAAVSTGGFSPHDDSLRGTGPAFQTATLVFCVLGAVPLVLYHHLVTKGLRSSVDETQWRVFLGVSLVIMIAVTSAMWAADATSNATALRQGPLMALSAQTTAGFSTVDLGQLEPGSKLLLIGSMLTGGCFGSTAGGVKILRLLILVRVLTIALARTATPPHAVVEPRLGRHRLQEPDVQWAFLVVALFLAVVTLSWLVFLLCGHDPLDALFEVASATGTVGLSSGLSGPGLEPGLKLVLCLDMLMGRLEVFALLVLFYPRTWLGPRRAMRR